MKCILIHLLNILNRVGEAIPWIAIASAVIAVILHPLATGDFHAAPILAVAGLERTWIPECDDGPALRLIIRQDRLFLIHDADVPDVIRTFTLTPVTDP
jgi:hypothetical protein